MELFHLCYCYLHLLSLLYLLFLWLELPACHLNFLHYFHHPSKSGIYSWCLSEIRSLRSYWDMFSICELFWFSKILKPNFILQAYILWSLFFFFILMLFMTFLTVLTLLANMKVTSVFIFLLWAFPIPFKALWFKKQIYSQMLFCISL